MTSQLPINHSGALAKLNSYNSVKTMQGGNSQISLFKDENLHKANYSNQLLKGPMAIGSSESKPTLPGSRLNLNKYQHKELEMLYSGASNFARKSYGGNTQKKYQTAGQQPIEPIDKSNKMAMKSLSFARSKGKSNENSQSEIKSVKNGNKKHLFAFKEQQNYL